MTEANMDTFSDQSTLTADEMQLEVERAFRRGIYEGLSLLQQYFQLKEDLTLGDLQRMVREQAAWQRKIGLSAPSESDRVATLDFAPLHKEVIHLSRQHKRHEYVNVKQ